jgi:hypothetical protein
LDQLLFHDNQGTIDYQYKDAYWYLYFDRCSADGALAITNPATQWYAGGENSSMTLRGSISGTTDQLAWTNTLTGQSGTLSAQSNWEIPNIGLQAGTNIITVSGRVFGKAASDSPTNAAYADGWQVGDNGGTVLEPGPNLMSRQTFPSPEAASSARRHGSSTIRETGPYIL